ncbi:hypothetical protein [Microbacterium dextranolyticum]|uniref:Uncharacterized protein n=1 Tax=Microbacterium dextranolyticum TaxID=36806 RepID=A0A9W6HPR1_9MICO|nr:hypothetical protein [Microbacterium dextranolyticum]MBM7462530.1 hypothetical protein [Microbacterium dextranolyticum]GLJ96388.1 hypothetical protein GCM10017591_24510 [Microbacterium dextranolyticum]
MPSYENPLADAAEASEALRGLAHATRTWNDPADTYGVIGELAAGIRSLHQILGQLATVHTARRDHVSADDGDRASGAQAAAAAAAGFQQAAALIDQADDQLSAAFAESGRIVWHPSPAPAEQWITVVFLQGEEADRPLRLLGELGHVDAVDYLAQWDYGDETTQAALENGYVYDEPGAGTNDQVVTSGDYALVINPHVGYVSLLRRTEPAPEAEEVETLAPPAMDGSELLASYSSSDAPKRASVQPAKRDRSWFEPAAITAVKQARGLTR